MADPLSFRAMRILFKPNGTEAEIAVSDFDSRKHFVLAPPVGAPVGWQPPVDNAPEGERVVDAVVPVAPTLAKGTEPRSGREDGPHESPVLNPGNQVLRDQPASDRQIKKDVFQAKGQVKARAAAESAAVKAATAKGKVDAKAAAGKKAAAAKASGKAPAKAKVKASAKQQSAKKTVADDGADAY